MLSVVLILSPFCHQSLEIYLDRRWLNIINYWKYKTRKTLVLPCLSDVFQCSLIAFVIKLEYKKNMFALLGKPGNEELKAQLEARLK